MPENSAAPKLIGLILSLALIGIVAIALGVTAYERNKVKVSEGDALADMQDKAASRDPSAWLEIAGKLIKEKKYAEARIPFERALEIAPHDADANAGYAGVLIEVGEYELGSKHLERAIQSDANHLDAMTKMGHLQSNLGNFKGAAKCFEAAVLSSPNDEDLQSCLIASHIRGGNLSDAERFSHANLEIRPNSAKANVDYASVLVAMAENAKAIEYCEKAIALDDGLSTAHATLATLEPDPEKARRHLLRAIELEPLSFAYNQTLGDMLMEIAPKEAIEKYETALKSAPDSVEVLLKIGAAWDACGQPAKGIPYLERVTKLLPDWDEARQSLELLRRANSSPQE